MSLNKITLIGRLGADPELKYTQSGKAVCNFSIATSESWTDRNGERHEQTQWHRIVAWDKQAELVKEYLAKGREVYIEGKMTYSKYTNKEGVEVPKAEVVMTGLTFVGNKPSNGESNSGTDNSVTTPAQTGGDDDLPF